ncbi:MAG: AMP-binding protein [Cellvibrio sp.]|uniref:AMP-binding protein n=1 Tax=Cellvibrio sp. TaxID=1965322 RepID=UPI0031A572C5
MNNFFEALESYTQKNPKQIALISDDVQISFAELVAQVANLADWLAESNIGRAGLWGENSIEWIIADLAAWKANITLVPLPRFFSAVQLHHVIEHSQLSCILVVGDADSIAPVTNRVSTCVQNIHCDHLKGMGTYLAINNICKVTYTSGTTGAPKGVCLTSGAIQNVTNALTARIYESPTAYSELNCHFTLLPLSTLLENIAGVYVPLLMGKSIIVLSGVSIGLLGSSELSMPTLLRRLHQYQPSSLIVLPQILMGFVGATVQGFTLPPSLKFIAVGGARTSAQLLDQACALGIPVHEGYGLSECASVVSLNSPLANKIGSVGRPLNHVQVKIENGEINVRGNTFSGYLGQPPHETEDWLATGDLGYIDEEGFLFITGRKKNLLISSFGRNISPEWIESELALCRSIAQCMVIGDAQPFCSAIVVPSSSQITADQIEEDIERVNQKLPDYAQVKKIIFSREPFTPSNHLLTDNGRLRRVEIFTHYRSEIESIYSDIVSTHPAKPQELTMTFFDRLEQETQQDRMYLLSSPIIQRCMAQGQFSLAEYIEFLTQAYHHVKHTVPLLMAVGSRLPAEKESYREAIAEYIEEELGHQEWILNDLAACGEEKETIRYGRPNMATELMVSYAYDTVMRNNPMAFFGMVFVLEGTSINLASPAADIIQAHLGLPNKAFSYLRSHGSLDQEHIVFFAKLMNSLTDEKDQEDILHAAKMFFRLYGNIFRSIERVATDAPVTSSVIVKVA